MYSYELSFPARKDIKEIVSYTLRVWGEAQAEKYTDTLERTISRIALRELQGHLVSDAHPDIFRVKCLHHYLFFRREQDHVVILAVLHEKKDFLRHLEKRLS